MTKIMAPNKDNVCAIIVTYHPDEKFPERLEVISKQVHKVVIVDNSSSFECISMLTEISVDQNIHLILNEQNLGVATALNYGFNYAISSDYKYEWCLTMDQDTIVKHNMVQNLINAYDNCPFKEDIGIIGSNYEEYHTGRILFDKNLNQTWAEVQHLPTSGCLNSIRAYEIIGKFRDNLFIDYVDTEFCMRMIERGYRVIICTEISMKHPLGNYKYSSLYKFLFGREVITNYPPIRHFYWTRNGLILIREQIGINPKWAFKELYYLLIRRVLIVILFEDFKIRKLKNIFLGVTQSFSYITVR